MQQQNSFIQHEFSMSVTTLTRVQSIHLILVWKKRFHHAVQMTQRKYDSGKLLPISSNTIPNRNQFLHFSREGNVRQVCPIYAVIHYLHTEQNLELMFDEQNEECKGMHFLFRSFIDKSYSKSIPYCIHRIRWECMRNQSTAIQTNTILLAQHLHPLAHSLCISHSQTALYREYSSHSTSSSSFGT